MPGKNFAKRLTLGCGESPGCKEYDDETQIKPNRGINLSDEQDTGTEDVETIGGGELNGKEKYSFSQTKRSFALKKGLIRVNIRLILFLFVKTSIHKHGKERTSYTC